MTPTQQAAQPAAERIAAAERITAAGAATPASRMWRLNEPFIRLFVRLGVATSRGKVGRDGGCPDFYASFWTVS
jgi:hypothetical protein